jgi:hypothetical protein
MHIWSIIPSGPLSYVILLQTTSKLKNPIKITFLGSWIIQNLAILYLTEVLYNVHRIKILIMERKFTISEFWLQYVTYIKSQDGSENKVTGKLHFDSRNARKILAHNRIQTGLRNHTGNFEMRAPFRVGGLQPLKCVDDCSSISPAED